MSDDEGPRVALDLDSTLTATGEVAFDLICGPDHDYDYSDITDWTWGFEEFGKPQFLNAMWHAWTLRPDEIELFNDTAPDAVDTMHANAETLDIVTKHPEDLYGVDGAKQAWLDRHEITYDAYRSVSTSKHTLDYDIYIDDNPMLAREVTAGSDGTIFVYDQPYNRTLANPHLRVVSLKDAESMIKQPYPV